MILCATGLSVLLLIDGLKKNPEPCLEAEKILKILCRVCNRNLKQGNQCNTRGRWLHNSCGNAEAQVTESGKWICCKRRSESFRMLEEKLQNAQSN